MELPLTGSRAGRPSEPTSNHRSSTAPLRSAALRNHPSIMVWAWFNEGPSNDPRACPAYAACAQVASRDPTRLRSWASNKMLGDL